jgi:hypothetical protein
MILSRRLTKLDVSWICDLLNCTCRQLSRFCFIVKFFWTLLEFQYLWDRTHFVLSFVQSIAWFEVILLYNLHRSMNPFESQCLSFLTNCWDMIFQFMSITNLIQFSKFAKASTRLVKYDLVRNSLSSFRFEKPSFYSVFNQRKCQISMLRGLEAIMQCHFFWIYTQIGRHNFYLMIHRKKGWWNDLYFGLSIQSVTTDSLFEKKDFSMTSEIRLNNQKVVSIHVIESKS